MAKTREMTELQTITKCNYINHKRGQLRLGTPQGAAILQAFAHYYTRDPRMCGLYPHSAADAMVDHGCIPFLFLKKSFVYLENPTVRYCKMNTLEVEDDTPRSDIMGSTENKYGQP